jgi:glycolate oxidase
VNSAMETALQELRQAVGTDYVIHTPEDLIVFEYDGAVDKAIPLAVVIPETTQQVSECVTIARRHDLPIIARGAGTGLSGGAIAEHGGIVIALTRMTKILEVDTENRIAIVEPGVVNLDLSTHVAPMGLYYAPDPSSQRACTIGGNVAENSGGPHCLAYGVTTNHILGMEVVFADGSIQWIGGRGRESVGYDLRGILVGSEGTLAITTKVVVRLLTLPESVKTLLAVFRDLDDASAAVTGIIGAGIVPAALEMMDDLCIEAAEASVHVGYPEGAGAVLLVEVDGITEAVEEEVEAVEEICNRFRPMEIRTATDADERERLWSGRKGVLGALGRLAPNYLLVDGTVPRTKLVEVLSKIRQMSADTGYPIANLLHAGDGNLHPSVLFDERIPGDTQRALKIGGEILELCIEVGGVLSGEHGIGLEKKDHMPLMFNEDDLAVMAKLKPSFATEDSLNPGKVFPTGATCGDVRQAAAAIARVGPGAYV